MTEAKLSQLKKGDVFIFVSVFASNNPPRYLPDKSTAYLCELSVYPHMEFTVVKVNKITLDAEYGVTKYRFMHSSSLANLPVNVLHDRRYSGLDSPVHIIRRSQL